MTRLLTTFLIVLAALVVFGWIIAAISALIGAAFWLVTLPLRLVGETFAITGGAAAGQALLLLAAIVALYVWHKRHHGGRTLSFASGLNEERWERKVRQARRHWDRRNEHIADLGDKASDRLHRWSVRMRAREHRRRHQDGGAQS